jgi:gas vesicle protein
MQNESGHEFLWFCAGALVGTAIGMLYAPRSGREARHYLADTGRDVAHRSREYYEKAAEQGHHVYDRGREVYGRAAEKGREVVERGRHVADEASDLLDRGKNLVRGQGPDISDESERSIP